MDIGKGIARMGQPSWWIIAVLDGNRGLPAFEIIRAVEAVLRTADYPLQRLRAATTHHALERMEEDGFVERSQRELDVPVGHGATRRELATVWKLTQLGTVARAHHHRMQTAFASYWPN